MVQEVSVHLEFHRTFLKLLISMINVSKKKKKAYLFMDGFQGMVICVSHGKVMSVIFFFFGGLLYVLDQVVVQML